MTSIEDYLRAVRLPVEQFDRMPKHEQDAERDRYIEWLKLKLKNPQPAPGNFIHLRRQLLRRDGSR